MDILPYGRCKISSLPVPYNTAPAHTTTHDTCRPYQPAVPRAILAEPNGRRQRLRYRGRTGRRTSDAK